MKLVYPYFPQYHNLLVMFRVVRVVMVVAVNVKSFNV